MTGNRDAIIGHRCVTFLYHVGRDIGVSRAGYAIALESDEAPVKADRRRPRFNLAAVVGVIANANQINHYFSLARQVAQK